MATEVNIPGPACDSIMEGSVHMEDQVIQISLDKFPQEKIQDLADSELHRTKGGTILEILPTDDDQLEASKASQDEKPAEINAREQTTEEMIQQHEGVNKDGELIKQKQGDVSNNQNETIENTESEKGDTAEITQARSLENPVNSSPDELSAQISGAQIVQDEQSEQESECIEVLGKETSESQLSFVQETVTEVGELKKTEFSKTEDGETDSEKTESEVVKKVESLNVALEDKEASGLGQEIGTSPLNDQIPTAVPQVILDDSADDKAVVEAEDKEKAIEIQATIDSGEKINEELSKVHGLHVTGVQITETSASDQAQNDNTTPCEETKERSLDLDDVKEETQEQKNVEIETAEVNLLTQVDDSGKKHEEHIEKEIGEQSATEKNLTEKADDIEALTMQDAQIRDGFLRVSEPDDIEKNEESTLLEKEVADPIKEAPTKTEDKTYDSREDAEQSLTSEKPIVTAEDQENTTKEPKDAPEVNIGQIEQEKQLKTETENSLSNEASTTEINDDKSLVMHKGQTEDVENSEIEKDTPSVLSDKEREMTEENSTYEEFPSTSEEDFSTTEKKEKGKEDEPSTTIGDSDSLSDIVHESVTEATENKENEKGDEAATTLGHSGLLSNLVRDSVAEEELKKGALGESENRGMNAVDVKLEAENAVESGSGQETEMCSANDQPPTSEAQGVLEVKAVNEDEQIVESLESKGTIDPEEKNEKTSGNIDDSQVEEGTTSDNELTLSHVIKTEDGLSESLEYDKSKEIALLKEAHTEEPIIDHGELEDDKITDGDRNTESSTTDVPENKQGIPSEQTNEGSIDLADTEETQEDVVTSDANSLTKGDSSQMTHGENVKVYTDKESLTEASIEKASESQNLRESENVNIEIHPEPEDIKVSALPEDTIQIGDTSSRESEYINNEKDAESDPGPEINTEQTGDEHTRESENLNNEKNVEINPEQEDKRLLDSNEGSEEIGDDLRESDNLSSENNVESTPEPEVNKTPASNEGTEPLGDEYGESENLNNEKSEDTNTEPEVKKVSTSEGTEQFLSTEEQTLKAHDVAYTELNAEVDGSRMTHEKEFRRETETTSPGEALGKENNDVETLVINEDQSGENPRETECSNSVKEGQSVELNKETEDSTQSIPLEEKKSDPSNVFLTEEQNPTVDPQQIIDNEAPDAEEVVLEKVGETITRGSEACIRDESVIETVLTESKEVTESELTHKAAVEENTIDSKETASDDVVTSIEGHQTETYSINEQVLAEISQEHTSDIAEYKTIDKPDTEETPKDDATVDISDRDSENHSNNLEKDIESSDSHEDKQTITHEVVDESSTKEKSFTNEISTENILAMESNVTSSPEETDVINKSASLQDSETFLEEQSPTKNTEEVMEDEEESNKYVVDCSQVKNEEHLEKDVESSNEHDAEPTTTMAIEENVRFSPEETDLIHKSTSHEDRKTEESKPYEVEMKEETTIDKNVLTRIEEIQENSMTMVEGSYEEFERSTENVSEQQNLIEASKENVDDESSSIERGEYIKDKENCDDEGKDNRAIIEATDRETEDQSNETIGEPEANIVQVSKGSETTSNELKMQTTDEQLPDVCSEVKTIKIADIIEEDRSFQGLDDNSTIETTKKEYESESTARTDDETGNGAELHSAEEFTESNITSIEAKEQLPAESLSHDLISEASSETGKLSDANEKGKPCAEYDHSTELREEEAPKDPENLLSNSQKNGINEASTDTKTTIESEMPEHHEPEQTAEEESHKEIASETKPIDIVPDEAKDIPKVELEEKVIVKEDTENQSVNIISELQRTAEDKSLNEIASEIKLKDVVPEENFESKEKMDEAKDVTKVELEEKTIVEEDTENQSVNIISEPQQTAEEESLGEIASEIKPKDVVPEENFELKEKMDEAKDATKVELEEKTTVEEDTENQSVNIIAESQQTAEEESLKEIASETKPKDVAPDEAKDTTKVELEEKITVEEDTENQSVNIIPELQQTAEDESLNEIASEIKPNDIVTEETFESKENMHDAKDTTRVELEEKKIVEKDTENQNSSSYEEEVMIQSEPEGEITKEEEATTKETNEAENNLNEKGIKNYVETDEKIVKEAEIFSPTNEATDKTVSEKEEGAIVEEDSDKPVTEEVEDSVTSSNTENKETIEHNELERAPEVAEQAHSDIKLTEEQGKINDEKLEEEPTEKNSDRSEPKEASHESNKEIESETSSREDEESEIKIVERHLNNSKEEFITEVNSTDQSQHDDIVNREATVIQNANEGEKVVEVSAEADIEVAHKEGDIIEPNPVEQAEELGKDLESIKQVQTSCEISKDEEDKTENEKQEAMKTESEDVVTEDMVGPKQSSPEAKEIAQIDLSNETDHATPSSIDSKEIVEPEMAKIIVESTVQEPDVIAKAELVETIAEETAEPEFDDTSSKIKQSKEDDIDIRKGEITTTDESDDKISEGIEKNLVTDEEIVGKVSPQESIVRDDVSTLDTQEKAPSSDQGYVKDEGDAPISSNIEIKETHEPKDTDIDVESVSNVQSREIISETKDAKTEAVAVEITSDKNPVEERFDATNATDKEAEIPKEQMSSEKIEEEGVDMGGRLLDSCTESKLEDLGEANLKRKLSQIYVKPDSSIAELAQSSSENASTTFQLNEQIKEIDMDTSKETIREPRDSDQDQQQETNSDVTSEKFDVKEQNTPVAPQYDIRERSRDGVLQSEKLPDVKSLDASKTDDVPLATKEEENFTPAQAENVVPEDYAAHAKPKLSVGNENISVVQHEASSERSQGQCEAAQPIDLELEKPSIPELPQESLEMKDHFSDNKDLHEKGQNESDHEEANTDEEKDDKAESGEHIEAPVMVDAGDVDVKAAHKKSHNLLSGVGSKVKHSIAKVKKAITGKSSHQKPPSTKQYDKN